ncbi:hypothetical protein NE237_032216 [Protea cynaroides]|uniref:TIR domain-containing protein n=1 Tax=Protea cynaroides TaxID=273540 RepID=A0A9Q0L2W3_9MAGN|nr:hypothetical protein NE237_032216 [Protea cynaroides]
MPDSEVFISYKNGHPSSDFTKLLHRHLKEKEIQAFMDWNDLRAGQPLSPEFSRGIQSSKISIPVICDTYVESKWCLCELAEMVECYESKGQIIMPIFFKVKPTDVQNHKGIVKALFKVHKQDERILIWKNALRLVGGMAGYKVKDDGDHENVVKTFVERVLTLLSCFVADVEHPVKLSTWVEDIEKQLGSGFAFVGIYGERGIGKTTIAKALFKRYYREFGKKCIIENISEKVSKGAASEGETSKGKSSNVLQNLQKQFIEDISEKKLDFYISDVVKGKKLMKESLGGKRVLLILDGVDSKDQFEAFAIEFNWLSNESKIIITSRKKKFLQSYRIDEAKMYSPQKLDEGQSLELFCWHTFSKKQPSTNDYSQICRDVVILAKGLPLNLVKLADFLTNSNEEDLEVWEKSLEQLKKEFPRGEAYQKIEKWYKACCKRSCVAPKVRDDKTRTALTK